MRSRPAASARSSGLAALALTALLSPAISEAAPLRVAVLDFENASADRSLDPWGKGLQSMLITDLSEVRALQLVERARLADVQRELALGRSRAIDAATAARLGKLVGASHLVAGTFTVAGKQLRIDLRVFSVERGDILLSEKSEGETEAFFEVQKALVKRVLDAFALRLEPKERAALMRPQTADLSAFRAFSSGLSLFDEKRYDEALAAIKEARRRDQDFKLAEVTEAEYERAVAELRTEAVAIGLRNQAKRREAEQRDSKVHEEALRRLYEIAGRGGEAAREERVVALGALESWLDDSSLPAVPDAFARSCMADAAAQGYLAEVLRPDSKAPMIPIGPSRELVLQAGAFEGELRKLTLRYRDLREGDLLPSPGAIGGLIARQHLVPAERADLRERLYRSLLARGPNAEWKLEHLLENARDYREALAFDRSTALFQQAAQTARQVKPGSALHVLGSELQQIADEIELNQQLSRAQKLATTKARRELFEKAAATRGYEAQQLQEDGARALFEARRFPGAGTQVLGPVLLGKHRVWAFGRYEHALTTGPRREGVRTSELRYAWEQRDADWSENFALFDCLPRKDFAVKLAISFVVPGDLDDPPAPTASPEAVAAGIDPRRPSTGVIFGVSHPRCCEMSGYAVLFGAKAVQLVQLAENPRELKAHAFYARTVLDEKPLALGGAGLSVAVEVTDAGIDVRAGGRSVRLKSPAERSGYYGLYFGGHGYAAASEVEFK